MTVNHSRILKIFAQHKVRFKEALLKLGKHAWLMSPDPLGCCQGPPRIGKVAGPMQRQSNFLSLPLQHLVDRPIARSHCNSAQRNVGVCLEWQLNRVNPVPGEYCVSVLPDVAERAKKVIPMQHRSSNIHVSPQHGNAIPLTALRMLACSTTLTMLLPRPVPRSVCRNFS